MKTKLFALISLLLSLSLNAATPWDGTTIATSFAGGTGTSTDPYQISSPAELAYLSQVINANTLVTSGTVYFILTSDLDLNNQPWTPIGNSDANSFKGRFNGNSHLISNLTVNLPNNTGVGLFGYINNAFIYDLGIVGNSSVIGKINVGGIVGRCYITSIVTGNSIKGCFSNASVTSTTGDGVGGIVGDFRATGNRVYLIDNCYSTGNITGNNFVAGIVGKVELPALTISNSYATGTITATGTAPNNLTGGIATIVSGAAPTITNCYYINGNVANANGATVKTDAELKAAEFLTTLNATSSNWQADFAGAYSVNNGYPINAWRIQDVATKTTNVIINNGTVSVVGKSVKFVAPESINNIQLYNFSGQLVDSKYLNYATKQFNFDVQHAGIYLLIVHTADGRLSQKILIK